MGKIFRLDNLEYLLLFLSFMNFGNKAAYFIFGLFVFLMIRKKILISSMDKGSLFMLVCFCIMYAIFGSAYLSGTMIPAWLCSFLIGVSMVDRKESLLPVIGAVALGLLAEGFLTVWYSPTFTIDTMGDRFFQSIWGNGQRASTAQDCSFYLYSACMLYLVLSKNTWFAFKILFFALGFFFVFDALVTATRSVLLYCIVVIIFSYFIEHPIRQFKYFAIGIIILVAVFFAYNTNFLGFQSFFESSFLFERIANEDDGGVLHNSRLGSWSVFANHWSDYLWGGLRSANTISYMHNILLDTYASAGLLTFLFLLMLIINSITITYKIYKCDNTRNKYLISSCLISFLLVFNSEPIIESAPIFFMAYLFFVGMINKYYYNIARM